MAFECQEWYKLYKGGANGRWASHKGRDCRNIFRIRTGPRIPTIHSKPMLRRAPSFPVVGIGASAGGLEVFKLLLADLPIDTGLAIVFIQHLDPKHHSMLAEILARATAMPVSEAADGMPVEANHVYVIPANIDLTMRTGR
jgi:two-component system CheB/CheR fusion protein